MILSSQRLKDEVIAWHTLHHQNIAQLYGVIQSCDTIAMISPWCNNGTLIDYLEVNPSVNRLELVSEYHRKLLFGVK
jgi:serine/threonine protein kinase